MGEPTYFIDDVARDARELEVVNASFLNGMNLGGSNAPGVGINMNEGAVVGTPEQFTLLDQFEDAREGQISQHLGGLGYSDPSTSSGSIGTLPGSTVRFGTLPTQAAKDADSALDGTIINVGNATLTTIEAGWVVNV